MPPRTPALAREGRRNRRRRPDVGSEDTCHSSMALNPHPFRDGGEFEAELDAVIEVLHDTPPADADLAVQTHRTIDP